MTLDDLLARLDGVRPPVKRPHIAIMRAGKANCEAKLVAAGWPGTSTKSFERRPVTLDGVTVEVLSVKRGAFWIWDAAAGLVTTARTQEAALLKMAQIRQSGTCTGA